MDNKKFNNIIGITVIIFLLAVFGMIMYLSLKRNESIPAQIQQNESIRQEAIPQNSPADIPLPQYDGKGSGKG